MELSQDEVDRIFHALADATRRDILARVIDREQSVSMLARSYSMSLPAVQKHVGVLEGAGLVSKHRVGREQRVTAEPDRIRSARQQLDRLESLWRHRVAAMDGLLAEDPTEQNPTVQDPTEQNPTVQDPTEQNPTVQHPTEQKE